jgi:hypothetical protein
MDSPPRYLVYWINAVASTRCALVNTNQDLLDGVAIKELTEHVMGCAVPFADTSSTGAG